MIKFSVIIPVYNRPDELKELLESLKYQIFKNFEVIVVEDGSTLKSDKVVEDYQGDLDIKYFLNQIQDPDNHEIMDLNGQKAITMYFSIAIVLSLKRILRS